MAKESDRTASAGVRKGPSPIVPPWVLLWLIVYTLSLPGIVRGWLQSFLDLVGHGAYSPDVAATLSFRVLRFSALAQLIPSLAFVGGILTIVFPQVRAAVVERRLGLKDDQRPVIAEMQDFVHAHAPGVDLRSNVVRQGRIARVYPTSWRRARIAIFGPMVALWRRDRQAAQAVLLHEVAHFRAGDHLILGLGSPFVALVNLWFPVLTIFGIILIVLAATQYPTAIELVALFLLLLTFFPRTPLLPVSALWAAEVTADRYVVETAGREALLRALAVQRKSRNRYSSLLTNLSHPPRTLRTWAATGAGSKDISLLTFWPLLTFALLLMILASAVPGWLLLGYSWPQVFESAISGSRSFIIDSSRLWGTAVVLLLVWPAVSGVWTRWWTGIATRRTSTSAATYVTAAVTVALLLGGLLLLLSHGF